MAMSDVRVVLAREERAIHEHIRGMARLARSAFDGAVSCLREQDVDLAERIVREDAEINALRRQVERECLFAIASQQPVAGDLREIVADLLIASDLERMADHAAGIAKIVLEMDPSDVTGPTEKLWRMSEVVGEMIDKVWLAYDTADESLARQVGGLDAEVDDLHEELLASLVMRLATEPDTSSRATHLLWITHKLERIGDHATNVAERVVFMVSGETPELN
jgi:phosphate transport system protein